MFDPNPAISHLDDRLLMLDSPRFGDVLNYARRQGVLQDFRVLRSYFSSPRLFDVYVRGFSPAPYKAAGLSLLDKHTMLADNEQKTVAIHYEYWMSRFQGNVDIVDRPDEREDCVRVQVWAVNPQLCGFNRMLIGVLLSFTDRELRDPRLGISVNMMARTIGFSNND